MELLQAGVDCSVIALWLGHESIETTQTYLHAHLTLKEAALAKLKPYQGGNRTRFRPNDRLLAFLEALPSVPMKVRHPPPGNLDLRARKDNHAHAHAPATDRCRGGRHRERRP